MRDDATAAITRLDLAQAPPLAFFPGDLIIEARIALPPHATLLAYTDGVIERRDQVIDEGIARLESAFQAADPGISADELAVREVARVTAADDSPYSSSGSQAPRRFPEPKSQPTPRQVGPNGRALDQPPQSPGLSIGCRSDPTSRHIESRLANRVTAQSCSLCRNQHRRE
ncbi:MAG: serine/threonine-protein phosphatase [Actinomycetota bacterium]|nr:serine/threonine-protein phosphatase [Actinomycetota bacterium]